MRTCQLCNKDFDQAPRPGEKWKLKSNSYSLSTGRRICPEYMESLDTVKAAGDGGDIRCKKLAEEFIDIINKSETNTEKLRILPTRRLTAGAAYKRRCSSEISTSLHMRVSNSLDSIKPKQKGSQQ